VSLFPWFMASDDTPLMQQWREIKARHPDALLFFRVGDFYEMFFEDAEEGARLLDLTLTSRNNGSSRAPLAGVPVHALNTYLQRLVRLGRRVAICEQTEDPAQAKGIVRREVVETVTPGAVFADALLDARRNNYLVALVGSPAADERIGIAAADLSTGELLVGRCASEELDDVLGRLAPAELLLPRSWELVAASLVADVARTYRGDWLFDSVAAADALRRRFGVLTLDGFGLSDREPETVGACGALLAYLAEVQPASEQLMRPPRPLQASAAMHLDEMTCRNLEIVEPLRGSGADGTLLGVLDVTKTAMGSRLLRRWLTEPLTTVEPLRARQDAAAELVESLELRRAVREAAGKIRDLERLAVKVASARVNPRELLAVLNSLEQLPLLHDALASVTSPLLGELQRGIDPFGELRAFLDGAIDPEAPVALADGRVIREGFSAELDELRATRDGAVDWITRMQATERERTGINSLKVGYNKVFGYYLEVTRSNLDRVPDDYQRKQTLANAERYVTPELKEWEERILGAEERVLSLETSLFQDVRLRVAQHTAELQRVAGHVAVIDVLASFAEIAVQREYVRPELTDDDVLDIRGGRHPVVELMMAREDFIPNDIRLDGDARVIILTGPNMAGKSTVLRQVGLIVLLAQIGAFVPADAARIGLVDRIFTRVGASDQLARGQSTFMVEMTETAAILHGATDRSLVLLDEIGRGTSTWDGLSVATAVTEHLHDVIGAKTIFATHYHELTRLAERLPRLANFSVAVREEEHSIVFLRRLVAGGADRSYGVEVARLAGLPRAVVERARLLLGELEAGSVARPAVALAPAQAAQLGLFDGEPHPVVERLRTTDVDHLTPVQALNLLAELSTLAHS
jgi:DNA mismatch repair protein MutS